MSQLAIVLGVLGCVLGVLGCVLNVAVAWERTGARHREYQQYRLRIDGWTLPRLMCWMYQFDLEHRAPRVFRRTEL